METPETEGLEPITMEDLTQGIELDEDEETLEEAHKQDSPTPDRPAGKLAP